MRLRQPRPRLGFNPRAREGRDQYLGTNPDTLAVSIHAPVRGATGHAYGFRVALFVSIHAPVRGATPVSLPEPGDSVSFQSTRP